jgi:ketosteroid isomerase-like protein
MISLMKMALPKQPKGSKSPKPKRSWTRGLEARKLEGDNVFSPTGNFLLNNRNIAVAKKYLTSLNAHSLRDCEALVSKDFCIFCKESELSWDEYKTEMQAILNSFPDFKFQYNGMELTKDGVLHVHEVIASGTHTGDAYAYGPYEPIASSGTFVENEPERFEFHFRGERICKIVLRSRGEKTGIQGIYSQLGGAFPLL